MPSADSNEASNDQPSVNKNLLVAQISNLSDPSRSRSVKHLSFKPSPSDLSQSKDYNALDLLPTAAECLFPWRRDRSYQTLGFGIWLTNQFHLVSLKRFVSFTRFIGSNWQSIISSKYLFLSILKVSFWCLRSCWRANHHHDKNYHKIHNLWTIVRHYPSSWIAWSFAVTCTVLTNHIY